MCVCVCVYFLIQVESYSFSFTRPWTDFPVSTYRFTSFFFFFFTSFFLMAAWCLIIRMDHDLFTQSSVEGHHFDCFSQLNNTF